MVGFYADYIEETEDWGVFDTEIGHCYSTWSDEQTATRKAEEKEADGHGVRQW